MGENSAQGKHEGSLDLPPGFRFHPTDEEIITHYLTEKVLNPTFTAKAIGEVDLNKSEPWDLPRKAKMGEKEWYFFCQRDRKYPTGMRTNRATEAGYWKATGKDKEIFRGKGCLIGMKKTLVFYKGRAPKGEKTNWVMHEFRLEGKVSYHSIPRAAKDEWVVCRVFHKSQGIKKSPSAGLLRMNSFGSDLMGSPWLASCVNDQVHCSLPDEFKSSLDCASQMKLFQGNRVPYLPSAAVNQEVNNSYLSGGDQSLAFLNPQFYLPRIPLQGSSDLVNSHQNKGVTCYPNVGLSPVDPRAAGNRIGSTTQSKVEQFSNQSMLSHDTGLTNDLNTEISSAAPKHELTSRKIYNELEGPSSSLVDLDCLWNY